MKLWVSRQEDHWPFLNEEKSPSLSMDWALVAFTCGLIIHQSNLSSLNWEHACCGMVHVGEGRSARFFLAEILRNTICHTLAQRRWRAPGLFLLVFLVAELLHYRWRNPFSRPCRKVCNRRDIADSNELCRVGPAWFQDVQQSICTYLAQSIKIQHWHLVTNRW